MLFVILIALLVEQWREKTDWIGILPLDREPRGGMLLEEGCGFSRDFSTLGAAIACF